MSKYLRTQVNQNLFGKLPSEIKYKTQIGVCVQQTLKYRGYSRAQANQKWDIYWIQKQSLNAVHQNNRITMNQKLNHFRTYFQLCRKDNLNRNMKKFKRNLEKQGKVNDAKQFDFFPLTYHLPMEYNMFSQQFKRCAADKQSVWIMKPVSRSQGKGIFLFNKLSVISQWSQSEGEAYVVQRYINNPLLVGGKKFDLRLYVLTTNYKPLTAYLYRQGFARFTTQRYDTQDLDNSEVHLTNVAIQKHSSEYNKSNGGKWELKTLKLYLLSKYNSQIVERCFLQIQKLIVKSLKGVSKLMSAQKNCFQLYGYDIMIDDNFKPWLIEVNGSPSMRANTKQDRVMKMGVIDDVLTIIDIEQILTGKETRIGGFDLICDQDIQKKPQDKFSDLSNSYCFLGCINNRKRAYFQLAHQINKKANMNNVSRQQIVQSPKKKAFSVRKQQVIATSRVNTNTKRQNPQIGSRKDSKTDEQTNCQSPNKKVRQNNLSNVKIGLNSKKLSGNKVDLAKTICTSANINRT